MINKFIKLDKPLFLALRLIAEKEKQSLDEVGKNLLIFALKHRQEVEKNRKLWQLLTRREKEIIALTCLSKTNREIADQLFIAPTTVKTHLRNARRKFGLRSKHEIRLALTDWDFSWWDFNGPGELNGS